MKAKFDIAKKREPYWWLKDDKDIVHRQYFSIYKATREGEEYAIIGVILGKFHWRMAFKIRG